MSFLEPLLLAGLPLVALPVLIHLLNRRRYRTMRWAAMMFLVDAQRLTRGMARLRYLLILGMRMLAIAALVFAISRPLATGWVGMAIGGWPETTIVLLDRSASMEEQRLDIGESKRSTGLAKLSELMETIGASARIVLIESTENRAREIDSPGALMESPDAGPSSTSADVPAMLEAALEYVVANQTGRTDIWILSDLRENDWKPDDARWEEIRRGFGPREAVRFYLLAYVEEARDNLAVRVTDVRRREVGGKATLVLDIALRRAADSGGPARVPLELVINGARTGLDVEVSGKESALHGHTVPLDSAATEGWGYVGVPNDSNPQDNVFHFVFAEPPTRRTVIVSEDARAVEPLEIAAASPVDPALTQSVTVLAPDGAHGIDWDATSLILWHAPLPDGALARQLESFAGSGRPVIFFPPARPATIELFGLQWGAWRESTREDPIRVASWRGDSDLLEHTRGGLPLPLDKLRTYRYATIEGRVSTLARLEGGSPLLTRTTTCAAPVYFCSTLPRGDHSSLARDGVALYVLVQRALAIGAATQGNARQLAAGSPEARVVTGWEPLSAPADAPLSFARPFLAGSFRNQERLIALNRPESEDTSSALEGAEIDQLFAGLDVRRVEDRLGSGASLASEIWRVFLLAMAAALLLEAWLCLPRPALEKARSATGAKMGAMTGGTMATKAGSTTGGPPVSRPRTGGGEKRATGAPGAVA